MFKISDRVVAVYSPRTGEHALVTSVVEGTDYVGVLFDGDESDTMIDTRYLKVSKEAQKLPSGGVKHDNGKSDLSMVSWELVELLGRVRMFGAIKYARDNWKQGFKVTRSCAAALRHIFLFLSGETLDPESGLSHLGHAVASLEHAIYDMTHHPDMDDRYKVSVSNNAIGSNQKQEN